MERGPAAAEATTPTTTPLLSRVRRDLHSHLEPNAVAALAVKHNSDDDDNTTTRGNNKQTDKEQTDNSNGNARRTNTGTNPTQQTTVQEKTAPCVRHGP